ncbi:hypothetical protein [Hymenobacter bucti]|uniref:STAS/SEC14 domain-containing protein n=1 Tax=Hymenobacter bucti TaxID=1844114 RepID=A0ABW4QU82_9BACT
MNLHLLRQTSCLAVYYDLSNDWLYLDWQGDVTLPAVQQACLELAACYLERPYSHVLNNNEQLTGISWNVATWLATDFLPYMTLAGIEHVAWVYSPSLRGYNLVHTVLSWLPNSALTTFGTVAEAVTWLRHTRTEQPRGYHVPPKRSAAVQATLAQEVEALRQRISAQQRQLQRT